MPRSIDEGFRDFLARLTPSDAESQSAKDHRASISTCLKNNFGLRRFVRIGSFGNGTSISGYSDVDYLASLARDTLTNKSSYSLIKVRNALDTRFPNSGVRVSSPAVTVPFGTRVSEKHEIVPADFIEEKNGFYIYDIADSNDGWMKACPDAHNAYVAKIDKKLGGRLKPLIRFVKAWKYFQAVPISSFYLELRTARYAEGEDSIVYSIDLKRVLSKLLENELSAIQDPIGISGYVRGCKTETLKIDALSKLKTATSRAEKACNAEHSGNISDAFAWYGLLYNNEFPSYYW